MRNLDIRELALHVDEYIRSFHRGDFGSTPILIADGDEPLAVVIRHQVYAPRLADFEMRPDGYLSCTRCAGMQAIIATDNPYNLGAAAEAANLHYRDTHQGAK